MTRTSETTTLVVEKLDLFTLPYVAWLSLRYRGGFYVYWSRSLQWSALRNILGRLFYLRQLRYEDSLGSYFTVQSIVTGYANEALCNHAEDARPLRKFLQNIRSHRLMESAFRKVVLETYTLKRIKTFVLAQSLKHEHSQPIVF